MLDAAISRDIGVEFAKDVLRDAASQELSEVFNCLISKGVVYNPEDREWKEIFKKLEDSYSDNAKAILEACGRSRYEEVININSLFELGEGEVI